MTKIKTLGLRTFQVSAILEGCSLLKDGGMSLRYHTNELTPEQKLIALQYYQKSGWLLFRENEFSEEDVPEQDAEIAWFKTSSQRLRAVLFLLWKAQGADAPADFQDFYRQRMEQFIDSVKAQLPA